MSGENFRVLVLGGSGGIGSALCQRLAHAGARVCATGRDPERLAALADIGCRTMSCEASEPGAIAECVDEAREQLGGLDALANCVGSMLLKGAHLTTDEEWSQTLALNLTTAFEAVRAGTRAMMTTGGSIVLLSSAAARLGLPNHEAIAAAKAGVVGLTLSAAATYAPRGIRVNAVAPGLVRTSLSARITGNENSLKASTAMHPLGRIGEPEDVASAIAWLLDPAQSWITGQVLGADGGLGSVRARG